MGWRAWPGSAARRPAARGVGCGHKGQAKRATAVGARDPSSSTSYCCRRPARTRQPRPGPPHPPPLPPISARSSRRSKQPAPSNPAPPRPRLLLPISVRRHAQPRPPSPSPPLPPISAHRSAAPGTHSSSSSSSSSLPPSSPHSERPLCLRSAHRTQPISARRGACLISRGAAQHRTGTVVPGLCYARRLSSVLLQCPTRLFSTLGGVVMFSFPKTSFYTLWHNAVLCRTKLC